VTMDEDQLNSERRKLPTHRQTMLARSKPARGSCRLHACDDPLVVIATSTSSTTPPAAAI
jgi:hypothetical protein